MLKINQYILLVVSLIACTSCEKSIDNSMLWGKTDYYEDFLFKDYQPIIMTKTLCFEPNEDADGRVGNVKFALYKTDSDSSYVPVENEVHLYKNGTLCSDNILLLTPQDKEVNIGIEFTPEAKEGVHKWFLKVIDNGGFDRINDYSIDEDPMPLLLEWRAEKNIIMNPLALGLSWFFVFVVAMLILWFCVMKPILYPTFKVGNIQMTNSTYFSVKKIHGARKFVATSLNRKQGTLNRLFTGKIVYERNEMWADEWELYPKGKSGRLTVKQKYAINPFSTTLAKQTEYQIEHLESNVKVQVVLQ